MAIAFRSAGTAVETNTTSTCTLNYTLTAGDTLFCIIEWAKNPGNDPTSVVWNGSETMTKVGATVTQSVFRHLLLYQLPAASATSGAHSIVITMDSGGYNVVAGVA